MDKLGFYINIDNCIGCRTCQVACKDKNNLKVEVLFRKVKSYEVGTFPDAKLYHYASSCNHCESPKCLEVCPADAIYKAKDTSVHVSKNLCIGCGDCAKECPYSVPVMVIADNGKDKMIKCDSCADLRGEGKNPVCVDACLMRCLQWGNIEEMRRIYGGDLRDEIPATPTSATTKPAILINPKECALETNFREQQV